MSSVGNPNIQKVLNNWKDQVLDDLTLLAVQAPFVHGYFGIHKSIYGPTVQLRSGLERPLIMSRYTRAANHMLSSPSSRPSYQGRHRRRSSKLTDINIKYMTTKSCTLLGVGQSPRDALLSSLSPSPSLRCRQASTANIPHHMHRPVASPSRIAEDIDEMEEDNPPFSRSETDILATLGIGLGVSKYEALGLIEECDGCHRVFMRSVLNVHIKNCLR